MGEDIERRIRRRKLRGMLAAPRGLAKRLAAPIRAALRPPDYGALQKRVASAEAGLNALVASRYPEVAADLPQRELLRRLELSVYSQNGEDGLLLHLFSTLGATDRRFVEFGIGNVLECNTTNLGLNFGWSGLLIDYHPDFVETARSAYAAVPERLQLARSLITPQNIDALLQEHGFAGEFDLLSIDIDGNDYWVWQAIEVARPRVMVVEYNASLGPDESLVTCYDESFDRYRKHALGWYHGASLAALAKLGRAKGYALVGCESSGFNAFFVREDVAKDRFAALTPEQAWYPDARRSRVASPAEQLASLLELPLERP